MEQKTATLFHMELAKTATIEIRPLQGEADKRAFRTLNEEWIAHYFEMEPKDREILENPDRAILAKGGQIFILAGEDGSAAGCAALIPMGDGVYELSKMAISPALRGRGLGRVLLDHVIGQARGMGAKSLFLGSNSKLANAVHLYETVGFRHIDPDEIPLTGYTRANVFMQMNLS